MLRDARILSCRLWCVLGPWLAALVPASGVAQDVQEEASRLFRAASAAHAQGDYAAAARTFEAAHDLVPSGATLFNAGVSWDEAGDGHRAADAFVRALRTGELTEAQRDRAIEGIERTAGDTAVVEVLGAGRARVAGRAERATPSTFVLAPGSYELELWDAGGTLSRHTLRVAAGDRAVVEVPAAVAASPGEPTLTDEGPAEPRIAPPVAAAAPVIDGEASRTSSSWSAGWTLMSFGLATVGVAAVTGAAAVRAERDYLDSFRVDVDARDQARRWQRFTNAAVGVAAAAALTGFVLVLVGRREDGSGPDVRLGVGPTSIRAETRW
ncbi:MAG: hypothetical protein AAGH15_25365 [Myxococcota bacterium]